MVVSGVNQVEILIVWALGQEREKDFLDNHLYIESDQYIFDVCVYLIVSEEYLCV